MLAGVLLHMIDPARPIDLSADWAGRKLGRGVVHDVVRDACLGRDRRSRPIAERRVHDFQDLDPAKRAKVVGLAAGRWVERGAVENDFPAVAFPFAGNDVRFEFLLKRIAVVQAFSHLSSLHRNF